MIMIVISTNYSLLFMNNLLLVGQLVNLLFVIVVAINHIYDLLIANYNYYTLLFTNGYSPNANTITNMNTNCNIITIAID